MVGSFLASFGGWINFLTILNLAVWRFGATPYQLIMLSAALLLPSVMLTKAVSRTCARQVGSAVIVLALAVTLVTTGALIEVQNFVVFLAVVALKSAALSFVDPWQMRYVTALLDEQQQTPAYRALAFTQNVAKISAPAAGAVLAAWAGDARTMLLSLSLIASAILLLLFSAPWRVQFNHHAAEETRRATRMKPWGPLFPLLYCAVILFSMSSAINNQFPLMLKMNGFRESLLGLLVSASALGGILGSALPMRNQKKATGVGSLVRTAMATAVLFIAIGGIFRLPLYPSQCLLTGAFFGTGLLSARFQIGCRIYISRQCSETVAQACTTMQSCSMLARFVAPFGGALLINYLTVSDVFVVLGTSAGCMLLVGSVVFRRAPANRTSITAMGDIAVWSETGSQIERDALR